MFDKHVIIPWSSDAQYVRLVDDRGDVCDVVSVMTGWEMRREMRDVRNYPGCPSTTAALLTQSATALITGALWPHQVLTGLRHWLTVYRGSAMRLRWREREREREREIVINIIMDWAELFTRLVSPSLSTSTRAGPSYTEHSSEKIGSENNSLMSLENRSRNI